MSLEVIEDNCLFICGHCNADVGRMNEIMEGLASKHHCLRNCVNIEMDFESNKIYRSIPQIELDSSPAPRSSTCASSSNDGASTSQSIPQIQLDSSLGPKSSTCASTICSTASTSQDVNVANTMDETKFTWTHEAIKLLICSFTKHKDKFESPSYTKKHVWQMICAELGKKGIVRTYQKCDEKWRNLKKTYDKILTEKNKTGNHSIQWRYFEDFQEIYFRDPYFEPIATVSSTGLSNTTKSSETLVELEGNTPGKRKNLSPGEISRKRTLSSYEIEQKRQKRHEDKMNLKREMFDWMKEHFGKK